MRIQFLNGSGGGFANNIDLPDGTTVNQALSRQLPGRDPADYLIRVNREACQPDRVLFEGDRLTVTPLKVEAGR